MIVVSATVLLCSASIICVFFEDLLVLLDPTIEDERFARDFFERSLKKVVNDVGRFIQMRRYEAVER